jgi:hypothetical protein
MLCRFAQGSPTEQLLQEMKMKTGDVGAATPETNEADQKFRSDLEAIFKDVRLVPDDIVGEVRSADYCEDGKTFSLMIDTQDGKTIFVWATPGEPLSISVYGIDGLAE